MQVLRPAIRQPQINSIIFDWTLFHHGKFHNDVIVQGIAQMAGALRT